MKPWIILTIIFATLLLEQLNSHLLKNQKSLSYLQNSASDEEIMIHFRHFHQKHAKHYDIDSDEGQQRFKKFKDNFNFINNHNSKKRSYTLGVGTHADLTNQEYQEKILIKLDLTTIPTPVVSNPSQSKCKKKRTDLESLASSEITQIPNYNWTYAYGTARNQGQCGSCWAFATAGAIEANYFLQFNSSVSYLSTQQLVDCFNGAKPCGGAQTYDAMNYIIPNGIMYDNAYPYTSSNALTTGTCQYNATVANNLLTSFNTCSQNSQKSPCGRSNLIAMLANGPVIAYFDAKSPIFQHYSGGILNYTCNATSIDHAINIVGVSSDSYKGYYIARNQYGTGWGENGYFRMYFDDNTQTCFIEQNAWQPVLKKTNIPMPPPPAIPCTTFYSGISGQGTQYSVCQSQTSLTNFTGQIMGLSMGGATEVTLFANPNCGKGAYQPIKTSYPDFTKYALLSPFINNVQSVIINWHSTTPPQGCIWVYSGTCFTGTQTVICLPGIDPNVAGRAPISFYNSPIQNLSAINSSTISSYRVGPGVNTITLYSKINSGGNPFSIPVPDNTNFSYPNWGLSLQLS